VSIFQQLEKCFTNWVKSINNLLSGEQIAIDGKTLRHSYDHNNGQDAIIMVSAWAKNSGLVLAQRKVSKKSNEITAIPELLKQSKKFNGSIKSKRNRAGWDDNYLREILLN
jgi:hypothetical protein